MMQNSRKKPTLIHHETTYDLIRKPTLVLMAGLPGSGKTTLATSLRHVLNCELISKDILKASLMNEGLSDEDAAWFAYEESFKEVSIALQKKRRSIILDSSALPFVWEHAQKLANPFGMSLIVLYCDVNNDVRMQRLLQREALISQQNANTFTRYIDIEHFAHLWPMMHIINTNASRDDCLQAAVKLCKIQPQERLYNIRSETSPPLQVYKTKTNALSGSFLTTSIELCRIQRQECVHMESTTTSLHLKNAA